MRSAGYLVVGVLAACHADTGAPDDVTPYEETAPSLWCSTVEPSTLEKMEIETTMQRTQSLFPSDAKGAAIQVHVHVINTGPRIEDGNVTDEQIGNQIAVLNAAYRPTGFSFVLATIDRTTSPTWFAMQDGTRAEHDAKAVLRKGTKRDGSKLNPFMPLEMLAHMDDTEKRALWAHLESVPAKPFGER